MIVMLKLLKWIRKKSKKDKYVRYIYGGISVRKLANYCAVHLALNIFLSVFSLLLTHDVM